MIDQHDRLPKLLLELDQLKLVERQTYIDGGDTFLYSEQRDDAVDHEAQCIERLAADHNSLLPGLKELWQEQEFGQSKEALF